MYNLFWKVIFVSFFVGLMVVSSLHPMVVSIKGEFGLESVFGVLGAIFVVILLVERATEIVIVVWRDEKAGLLKQELDNALLVGDENTISDKRQRLFKYKTTTKRIAILLNLSIAMVVCAAGVGLFNTIFDIRTDTESRQLLRFVDIFLTSGLIAGGSEGFHSFTSALDAFFVESKKRIVANS